MADETGSDRVSSVTDPVTGTVGYTYDTFGDRLSMTLPGGGAWTYAYGGSNLPSDEMLPKDDPNVHRREPHILPAPPFSIRLPTTGRPATKK